MSDAQERALERAVMRGDATALPALIRHRERRGIKTVSDETLAKIESTVRGAIHCRGIVDVVLVTKADSVGDPLVEVTLEHDMGAHDDESCCESGVEYVAEMLPWRGDTTLIDGIAVVVRIVDHGHPEWVVGDFSAHDAEEELDMLMREAGDTETDPPECLKNEDPPECLKNEDPPECLKNQQEVR